MGEQVKTFMVKEQPGGINRDRINAIYIVADQMKLSRTCTQTTDPPVVIVDCTPEQWKAVCLASHNLVLQWHQKELRLAAERVKRTSKALPGNVAPVQFTEQPDTRAKRGSL